MLLSKKYLLKLRDLIGMCPRGSASESYFFNAAVCINNFDVYITNLKKVQYRLTVYFEFGFGNVFTKNLIEEESLWPHINQKTLSI